jgi:hypothetical protein
MPASFSNNESATLRHISCMACESHTTVSFGPFGFLSKCADCGKLQHFDDLLEPMFNLTSLFSPVRRRVKRDARSDDMLASA